jgi:hypothetical protein
MGEIQKVGGPQTPWEPQGPQKKSVSSLYSKLVSLISSLFFDKKSIDEPQDIELQDFASLEGREEERVIIPKKEMRPAHEGVKELEKGIEEVAAQAKTHLPSKAIKIPEIQVTPPREEVQEPRRKAEQVAAPTKTISSSKVTELKSELLFGGKKWEAKKTYDATSQYQSAPRTPNVQFSRTKLVEIDPRSHEAPIFTTETQTKQLALLANGADLKTKHGREADLQAFRAHACLTTAIAHQVDPALNTNGKAELLGCVNAIEQVMEETDFSHPKDCEFVNELAKLMHKAFNVDVGGVGSMHNKKDWKRSWNDIGVNEASSFRVGANNEEAKAAFKEMLAFFRDNADAHFSETRHIGSRELAAGQVAATIGQLINDFTHDYERWGKHTSIARVLFAKMQAQHLVDPAVSFDDLEEMKNKMRENPLLAEVKNSVLQNEIKNGLSTDKNKEEMIALIEGELVKVNNQDQMKPDELHALANKIYTKFIHKIQKMSPYADKTGARGRLPLTAPAWQRSLGNLLAGKEGNSKSIAIAPHRENDGISDKNVKEALGMDNPKIAHLFAAIEGEENMLKRDGAPKVPLRLGLGLDGQFVKLLNPQTLLKETINDLFNETKTEILKDTLQLIGSDEFKNQYQQIVGNVEVTFNGATRQKIPLKHFAEMNSVANIMYRNNLRTICSISGTTVDIILSKIATLGPHQVKEVLQPLLDHLEGKVPDPLNHPGTPEGKKFKELASSISFFMQTGNYHTAAEVIGGMFIAARAQSTSKEENIDIDETFRLFNKLMEELAASPQTFFAVSPEDAAKIKEGEQQFLIDLAQAEKARMAQRQ